MTASAPQIQPRPVIRQLDEAAINRIAAGEVLERPASAVKELVENSIDAGAQRIEVVIADGGKTLIRVSDDGGGMAADDLPLALSRHATSKIDGSDLLNITSFGFRGEALASLGAVGRLLITSRIAGDSAHSIAVSGGRISDVRPAALTGGTVVERELKVGEDMHVDTGCIVAFHPSVSFDIQQVGGIKSALFGGEGVFFAHLRGPGKVWLQSLPFSRLAGRMLSAAPQKGGSRGEGSILGGLGNLLDGDNRF